jgi:hypothetical protein
MAPQDVVLIIICLILAPTILTTLLLVDASTFTFVAAIRQQFKHYLAEQGGVSETSGRWDHVWLHMEVDPSVMEQRPFLPQHSPLPPTPRKVIRRRAVDFTLNESPDDTRSPISFTSLSLFTQTPNSGQLRPLVLTEDATWDYALSMEDITFAFMTTAQRDWEAALIATEEERKARDKKERIEAKKRAKNGGKVNPLLGSIGHRLMPMQRRTGKTGTNKSP